MCSLPTAVVYSPFGHQAFILSSCLSIICPPQPCTRHPRRGFDAGLCCNAQRRNKLHWGWWITAVSRIPPLQALFQFRALEGCLHFPWDSKWSSCPTPTPQNQLRQPCLCPYGKTLLSLQQKGLIHVVFGPLSTLAFQTMCKSCYEEHRLVQTSVMPLC